MVSFARTGVRTAGAWARVADRGGMKFSARFAASLGALALASGMIAAGSAAAGTVTITYSGTADGINDPGDLFGLGPSVTSGAFVDTFVFDLSLGARSSCCGGADEILGGSDWGTSSPLISSVLTINGHSVNFSGSSTGEAYYQPGVFAEATSWYVPGGASDTSRIHLIFGADTVPAAFETSFSGTWNGGQDGDYFSVCGPSQSCNSTDSTLFGNLHPTSIVATFSDGVAAVPEPATWALMLFGVSAVGAGLRFNRRSGVVSAAT